jgi:hypothetical protein
MNGSAYLGDRQNVTMTMSLRRVLSFTVRAGWIRDTRAQQHVSKSARVDSCEGASIHDDNAVCVYGPRAA